MDGEPTLVAREDEQRADQVLRVVDRAADVGRHAVHRDVVGAGLFTCGAEYCGDGPLDQKFLVPENKMQSRD